MHERVVDVLGECVSGLGNHALSLCSSRPTNHVKVASVNPLPAAVMMDPFAETIDDTDANEHYVQKQPIRP